MDSIGPATPAALAESARPAAERRRDRAGRSSKPKGQILRGQFSSTEARILPSPDSGAHSSADPGPFAPRNRAGAAREFMRFLCRWQHLAPGTQLHGVDGLFQVLRQLQGYEISAAAWESVVLPRRVAGYDPEWLDRLCLAGEVMWGRLSPHPALESEGARRVRPTRVAPLAIFLREDAGRSVAGRACVSSAFASGARCVWRRSKQRGASFFNELVRATGRLASEVEDGLWELVAAGRRHRRWF